MTTRWAKMIARAVESDKERIFRDVRDSIGQGKKEAMEMLAFKRDLKEYRRQASIKVIFLKKQVTADFPSNFVHCRNMYHVKTSLLK